MGNALVQSATIQLKDQGGGVFGSITPTPGFSGGNAALGWTSPALENGTIVTVLTDGTNPFGAKNQATNILWDKGQEAYEDGVKNIYRETLVDSDAILDNSTESSELYDSASTIDLNLTTRPLRNTHSKGHYIGTEVRGGGFIEAPIVAGGKAVSVPEHNQHYMGWWLKYGYDFQTLHSFDYTGKTGSFTLPDLVADRNAVGENLTLNNAVTAIVLRDTGTELCVYTPGYRLRMNELANTTITGASSGATVSVTDKGANTDDHSGPEKVSRVWSESDGLNGFRHTWNRTTSASTATGAGAGGANDIYGDINLSPNALADEWAFFEQMIDLDAETVQLACNGAIISTLSLVGYTGMNGIWDKTHGLFVAEIGLQPIRILYQVMEFGDIYLDHEFRRVYIGNAATWGACTKWELQRTTEWATGEIKMQLNQGSLSDFLTTNAYIYICDGIYPDNADTGLEFGGV